MRTIILSVALLLGAGSAWGQTIGYGPGLAPGNNLSDVASVAAARDNLDVQSLAPRKSLLTLSFGALKPQESSSSYTNLTTYVAVIGVKAATTAIRVGFADPFTLPEDIVSVGIYPSDSYGGPAVNIPQWQAENTQTAAFPTANSVYQTCTTTIGSATAQCPNTALLPSAATMYVLGPNISPNVTTATVSDGTHVTLSSAATASGTATLQFANEATECKEYFDNRGAAVNSINTSGANRSLIIPGNWTSPGNTGQSFILQMGDLVPCVGVAQAQPQPGNTDEIFYIEITMGPQSGYVHDKDQFNLTPWNEQPSGAAQVGSRYIFSGIAWSGNTDWADNPAGTGFKGWADNPLQVVQYTTPAQGWEVAQMGDSISQAPPDDVFSTPVIRAADLISTPQAPVEVTLFAQGGEAWAQYGEAVRTNFGIINPSAIVGQPISRNEPQGSTLTSYQILLSRYEALASAAGARLGFYGAFPFTTSLDGSPTAQQGVATMRALLASISTTCQPSTGGKTCPHVPVLDPVPVISAQPYGGNWWDYPSTSATANGGAASGATSIPITPGATGVNPAYAGWQIRDITTPAAVASGCLISASSASAITVTTNCVIGSGIQSGDVLEFAIPGFTFGSETEGWSADNTHPWYPAVVALQSAADTFVNQLLGIQ